MGFHNHPEDFEYLLWTWRDYAIRWLALAATIMVPLLILYLFTQ